MTQLQRPQVHVRARAPLRISFAGGGTDVSPFPEKEGGAVLSATIDRYAYGSLSPRTDGRIHVESVDFGLSLGFPVGDDDVLSDKLGLVQAAIRRLGHQEESGYDLLLHSNAPPGSGLGSSSTMMVTLIGLLRERYLLPLDEYGLADLAYVVEREDLGIAGGKQDHYAATFGGFNYIEFGERVVVTPLRVRDSILDDLEMSLLLCYTGATRESANVIADQSSRVIAGNAQTLDALRAQKDLAIAMKSCLLRGELRDFGALLGEAWTQKQLMSPLISTGVIADAYEAAAKAGALGGKVTGAGGGGFILFYCDFESKHRVAAALESMGMLITEFRFEPSGVKTWTVSR